jgi:Mrp family chromosome partitioning ATPase
MNNISYRKTDITVAPRDGRMVKTSAMSYPMQEVAAHLFAAETRHPVRHIMLAGVTRKVGTSSVARGLSDSLAAGGSRVLIVELSIGQSDCMTLPRLLAAPDIASTEQPMTLQLGVDEVMAVISPGSTTFEQISRSLQERFDVVLWDLPPPGHAAPTAVAARLMDGVILVVQNDRTTRRALRYATERLRSQDAHILGVVLNRVRRRLPRWLDRIS